MNIAPQERASVASAAHAAAKAAAATSSGTSGATSGATSTTASAAAASAASTATTDPAALLKRVRDLPPLPEAALQALAALREDNASNERCGALIERDPALSARTLRLANSAFYGVPGRVSTVHDAVTLLGRRTLASLLTVATVSGQFDASACPPFVIGRFWRHSLAVAVASRAIARELAMDEDRAFTAGLLHDIGQLAMAAYMPDATARAILRALHSDTDTGAAELQMLGIEHAELGALVAAQWNFPPAVAEVIGGHHEPHTLLGGDASLTDIVHVADAIAHALDLAGDPHELVPPVVPAAWDRLALTQRVLLQVFRHTENGVASLIAAMGL